MKNHELQKILKQYDKNAEVRIWIWDNIDEKYFSRDFEVKPESPMSRKATKLILHEHPIQDNEDEKS